MGGAMTSVDEVLDSRLKTLLPTEYQETYEQIEPKPMRSAGLKYDASGQVAWDEIWGSFCDLAMAGGPPHKGRLLEPGQLADIDADFDRYDEVAEEICRGIRMVTGLRAYVGAGPRLDLCDVSRRRDGRLARPCDRRWRTSRCVVAARFSNCRSLRTSDSKRKSRTSSR
jgi:hypothetical protein